MPGILKAIKGFLTYTPSKKTNFELLEGAYEGVDRKNAAEESYIKSGNADQAKTPRVSKNRKMPLTVEDWNKHKKEEPIPKEQAQNGKVSNSLKHNLNTVRKEFGMPYNADIVVREFKIAKKIKAFIIYIDGMADRAFMSEFILRELMDSNNFNAYFDGTDCGSIADYITDSVISVNDMSQITDLNLTYYEILSGNTVLFIDGSDTCLVLNTHGYEKRNVDKPVTENVVMGSQEGFTENLRTNLSLVRKIIKNKNLITETVRVGKTNQAYVGIMYMNGTANAEVVKEVKKRLGSIDADFVLGDGMVGQYIEDSPFMIFPQVLTTERPDRTASFIMEGKVAIVTEGTPFAEIVPITFYHLLQTSEDAVLRWQYGTFLRMIRVVGIMIASFLPAMYVALTLFHQEMIPTELLASIAKAEEEVPFPTIAEILLLEISFELIREGGIRIPGVIGQTLGIIGALILGQAAVAAGLVSPILIIIVAVTGLGSFAIPNYSMGLGLRIVRFLFTFLAAILGFYGISLGLFIMACLTCSMKSFGVPFFSPVAPKTKANPDLVIRYPIWKQKERPDYLNVPDRKRQGNNIRSWEKKNKGGNSK